LGVLLFIFIDVLLGSINESIDPVSLEYLDVHISIPETLQPLAGPATRSTDENSDSASFQVSDVQIGNLTASKNENSDEPSMNLDPVNAAELVSTLKTQKPTKSGCSPLPELLVHATPKQRKAEIKNYTAHVLTCTESIIVRGKKQKKIEEMEEKQQKKEREMTKIAKKEEKCCKTLEREAKKLRLRNRERVRLI